MTPGCSGSVAGSDQAFHNTVTDNPVTATTQSGAEVFNGGGTPAASTGGELPHASRPDCGVVRHATSWSTAKSSAAFQPVRHPQQPTPPPLRQPAHQICRGRHEWQPAGLFDRGPRRKPPAARPSIHQTAASWRQTVCRCQFSRPWQLSLRRPRQLHAEMCLGISVNPPALRTRQRRVGSTQWIENKRLPEEP